MHKFLKENAEYFEKKAIEALREKPRFVLFFVEQAMLLYLKYILSKVFEDYPKTHRLKILFEEFSKVDENVRKFYEENSDVIDLIEEAYITARYLGKEYSMKSAERAIEILRKFKEEFRRWLD